MTEAEAREWLRLRSDVSRETEARLESFVAFVLGEAQHQNLLAPSTKATIWSRHIVDSAQLVDLADRRGNWLDLGSGSGFPGIVTALLTGADTILVEQRSLRADFLLRAAQILGMTNIEVRARPLEKIAAPAPFAVITARAFAPLPKLLELALRFSGPETIWLLPKGRTAPSELEAIGNTWQGDFQLVPSVTDPDSTIIVARGVRRR